MKQFRKIFNFELKYYLKNKVFAGVTVFLVLLIAVVMFFPRIMEAFKSGDDSTESAADLPVMLIKPDLSENTELITKILHRRFPIMMLGVQMKNWIQSRKKFYQVMQNVLLS